MPTEIASLYASIGADTSGLNKGLQQASGALRGVENDMKRIDGGAQGMESASRRAASGMDRLTKKLIGMVSVGAAVKLGQMVYELGELGAQAERTEGTFARIAGGADNAAQMLDALKVATMGTKGEAELMAGATNLMALGMGDTAEELGAIMRNVEGLGARFGGNMQTFQLMMSNDSLMRIDSFGIGVEEATKRIEEYKAAGMEAGEAFDTAILDLMSDKFDALGGSVEDATTDILRGKAAFADLKTEAGRAFAGFTASIAGSTSGLTQWATDVLRYTRKAREEYGYLGGSIKGMGEVVASALKAAMPEEQEWSWGGGATAILDSAQAWEVYAKAQQQGADSIQHFASFTGDSAARFEQYSAALAMGQASVDGVADAAARAANALAAYETAQRLASDSAAVAASEFNNAAAALSEMSIASYVSEQLGALKEAQDAGKLTAQEYAAAEEALLVQFGLLTEAERQAQGDIEAVTAAFLSGKINAEQFAAMLALVKGGLDALEDKTVNVRVLYTEEHRQLGAGAGATSIGNPYDTTIPHEQNASGGWLNTGGTSLVGERGPEMIYATSAGVQIEPLSGAGADGGTRLGSTWYGDIVIQGVADPDAAASAVIRKLADRGLLRAGGYR